MKIGNVFQVYFQVCSLSPNLRCNLRWEYRVPGMYLLILFNNNTTAGIPGGLVGYPRAY